MTEPAAPAATPTPACQNCGEPLLGEHCYACGQPVKGLVRHFGSILGDFFDSVLNIDARVFRTLWPLFARPGFLSREYFAGHRVRFVSPVRLFFFLSIVTFFVAQLTLDFTGKVNIDGGDFADATTVADVERTRDATLADLAQARRDSADVPAAVAGIEKAEEQVRERAQRRIDELQGTASTDGESARREDDEDTLMFNGRPWDARTNPIRVGWLPGFANRWLNEQAGHAKANIRRLREDPNLFKDAVLSAVPSTLFVLLPVFALMLKAAYLFKRRLYMEHLIVALHSHAFLCLALLGVFLLSWVKDLLAPGAVRSVAGLLEGLLWAWMPVYLLLMQKRIYGQGWPMTLLKYFTLGICYVVLLSFGAAATMLAGLVWM